MQAFNPTGPTVLVAGATTAPSGVQVTASGPKVNRYRVYNAGSVLAHYAFGATADEAQTNAVIATGSGSNAKNSIPLPPGAIEVITAPIDAYFSAITGSSTASIYVTPGTGI